MGSKLIQSFDGGVLKGKVVFLQNGPGLGPITYNNFRLASELKAKGWSVSLLGTLVKPDVFNCAPKGVLVSSLNAVSNISIFFKLVKYLRSKKPDVLFVSGPALHVIAGLAKVVSGYPTVLVNRVHSHTSSMFEDRGRLNRELLAKLMRFSNRWADFRLATSKGAAEDWANILGVDSKSIGVMYNPVLGPDFESRFEEGVNHPWLDDDSSEVIITVARLAPEKELHVLIRAFSMLWNSRKSIKLLIIGGGPLKAQLEREVEELGVEGYVDFVGKVDNPFPYMRRSDLFVLSSRYEGFANVVAEALACGCKVVSTNAPSGPSEILRDGEYGRLVPVGDVSGLSNAMNEALNDCEDKDRLMDRGKRFHVEVILGDIDYIFHNRLNHDG